MSAAPSTDAFPLLTLAHLSDLHLPMDGLRLALRDRFSKRSLNYASWQRRRRHRHRPEVLASLIADLRAHAPDHVVVTGDLTNLSLAGEVAQALPWLGRLGPPEEVTLVPGNHDALLAPLASGHLASWGDWMAGDNGGVEFPWVRIRAGVALVAVNTAIPTAPFLASGRVGRDQGGRLAVMLRQLRDKGLCRVVLMHHPPTGGGWRKGLTDAGAFRRIIAAEGAELVLHGHMHRAALGRIAGPNGPVPVIGVPSASATAEHEEQAARWHLLAVAPAGEHGGWRLGVTARRLTPQGDFETVGRYALALPPSLAPAPPRAPAPTEATKA